MESRNIFFVGGEKKKENERKIPTLFHFTDEKSQRKDNSKKSSRSRQRNRLEKKAVKNGARNLREETLEVGHYKEYVALTPNPNFCDLKLIREPTEAQIASWILRL